MVDEAGRLLFLMFAGHALCDFPLQPDRLCAAKRRGRDPDFPWWAALLGHGVIHGGAVALITGLWWLGAAETLAHALMDHGKTERRYGMRTDQAAL